VETVVEFGGDPRQAGAEFGTFSRIDVADVEIERVEDQIERALG